MTRVGAGLFVVALLATGCGSSDTSSGSSGSGDASKATSVADFGTIDDLIKAAKAEKQLNVIALPPDWANYGAIIDAFSKKYGIKVQSDSPNGTSQDEINAVKSQKGQDRAPDVLDVGTPFAQGAAKEGLLASYKVQTWDDITDGQKDPDGQWYNDYGGYISIGCDASKVSVCPTSFKDLLKSDYNGKVALNGDPTAAAAAFGGVWGAALANGGSLDDIGPGIDFFVELKAAGNFLPVDATPATVENGETPIVLDWDYLNAGYVDEFAASGVNWQVNDPTDGAYADYYSQAINKYAPHPAAARLWEEFLYSDEGQNLWLAGGARPVRLPAMTASGTADETLLARLPAVAAEATFPTPDQVAAAKQVVTSRWAQEMAG